MTFPKPALAAAAVLALAGCSATHIGDEWQCPLVQGATCTTVAGADPMVPDESVADESVADGSGPDGAAAVPLSPTPLYRPPDPGAPEAGGTAGVADMHGCYSARVFGADRRPNALTLFGIGGQISTPHNTEGGPGQDETAWKRVPHDVIGRRLLAPRNRTSSMD